MANNSSLYGNNPPIPEVSSSNSTSLYGGADKPIADTSGNVLIRGDLAVNGGDITTTAQHASLFNTNATTLDIGGEATTVNIGASTGITTINNNLIVGGDETIGGDLEVGGDLCIDGNTLTLNCNATGPANATIQVYRGGGANPNSTIIWDESVVTPVEPWGRWVFLAGINTAGATIGNVDIGVNAEDNQITTLLGDLHLTSFTNKIDLSQGLTFTYDGNNDRVNRINVQSSTGDQSGLRVIAPNATTNASSVIGAFSTNDIENGLFVNLNARGALTNPLRIQTGKYTAGVLGASGTSLAFTDNVTTYATVNPAGPTIGTDLATKAYVDSHELNTTYSINASSVAGGANFNLVGSDATTDSIKFNSGNGISVTRTNADTIAITNAGVTQIVAGSAIGVSNATGSVTISNNGVTSVAGTTDQVNVSAGTGAVTLSLPQSIATTSNPTFAGVTAGNITVDVTGYNTIATTADGLTLDPFNGVVSFSNYTFPAGAGSANQVLTTNGVGTLSWENPVIADTDHLTNGSFTLTLNADGTVSYPNYTFPVADGASGEILATDGAGTLYWTAGASGPGNQLVNGLFATTLNADGSLETPNVVYAPSTLTLRGGTVDPTNLVLDSSSSVTSMTSGIGGDTATLTATAEDFVFNHVAGGMVIGSVNGIWRFNADGTTSLPNYKFPYADGTANQVLKTNGSGVLSWYTPVDTNTTYTYGASSATGGANLTLTGSDATTNTVKVSSGTGVTVSDVSGTEISVAIGQDVATTASPTFANVIANKGFYSKAAMDASFTDGVVLDYTTGTGRISVGAADGINFYNGGVANTLLASLSSAGNLATTGDLDIKGGDITNSTGALSITSASNGNISLTPNGTGLVVLGKTTMADMSRVDGQLQATKNTSWTPPSAGLTTIAGNNGLVVGSSAGGAGYSPQVQVVYYSGDTTSGTNSSAALVTRGAGGTSAGSASAIATNQVAGTWNFDGYATNGWAQTLATTTSGGGTTAISPLQVQGYAVSAFTDNGSGTVTNAPMGFRVRGFAAATNMSTANRLNFIDHQIASATYKANTFTIQSGTATTNFAQFVSSGHTIGGVDQPVTITRVRAASAGASPSLILKNSNTVATTPATNDGSTFRFATAGSNGTTYIINDMAGTYSSTGDNAFIINQANGDQTTGTLTSVQTFLNKVSGTTISAGTPSGTPGASTVATVASFTPTNTTFKSNAVTLQNYAGTALTSAAVSYTRTNGEFAYVNAAGFGIAAQNTIYAMPFDTTNISSGVTTSSTSRINVNVSGTYKLIMSLQAAMATNSVGQFDFWLRKNGVDVANSKTQVDLLKDQKAVIAMDWMVTSNGTDYFEIVYASQSANFANITFPTIAATASPYVSPVAPALILNVIPVGM